MAQDSKSKDKGKKGPTKEYLASQEAKDGKAHKANVDRLAARKKAAAASLAYVGPNMAGEITLRQFQIFRGGLPEHLAAAVKDDREMKALFVPVADLSTARQQLKKKGSLLNRAHSETLRKYLASRGAK